MWLTPSLPKCLSKPNDMLLERLAFTHTHTGNTSPYDIPQSSPPASSLSFILLTAQCIQYLFVHCLFLH